MQYKKVNYLPYVYIFCVATESFSKSLINRIYTVLLENPLSSSIPHVKLWFEFIFSSWKLGHIMNLCKDVHVYSHHDVKFQYISNWTKACLWGINVVCGSSSCMEMGMKIKYLILIAFFTKRYKCCQEIKSFFYVNKLNDHGCICASIHGNRLFICIQTVIDEYVSQQKVFNPVIAAWIISQPGRFHKNLYTSGNNDTCQWRTRYGK